MTKAYLLDLGRCIGCQACVVACKTGNELPEGMHYIAIREQISGTFPNLRGSTDNHRCYHCADAACVSVCPTGALFKENGLTRLHRDDCSGCEYCVESCPYEVPVMVDGRSSKCDACASTTKAGGDPWCVTTCPSRALAFGERDEIIAEARSRATTLQARYANAQVYGETQAGGLGVIMVLPDTPEALGLPADPDPPMIATAWQKVVQPGSIALTAASVVAAGVLGVIARRNHVAELAVAEAAAAETSSEEA